MEMQSAKWKMENEKIRRNRNRMLGFGKKIMVGAAS